LNVTDPDGTAHEIRCVKRRFIPLTEGMTVIVEHLVSQGERLDNITAQYLGDSTQFWRICDTNDVMKPDELEQVGKSIKIAMPTV
jgi:hypothetical protein